MERKGRNLEEVVKLLEETLREQNIEVKSPDFILDKDTAQPREVDVSLRGKIGSSNILVIIECRDRMKDPPQDAIWIEQLTCKRDSVGADKVIAVSSKGFTEPAKIKAQKNKIELRTFDEIDPKEINQWFFMPAGYIYHLKQMKEISTVNINCNNPEKKKIEFPGETISWQAPIFVNKKDGSPVTLDFIWSCFNEKLFSDVPEDGSKIHLPIIRLKTPNFQLLTNSGPIDVISIDLEDANLWIEAKKVQPTFARAYKKETDTLTEIQEFELDIVENEKLILDFLGSEKSGKRGISVRRKDKSN